MNIKRITEELKKGNIVITPSDTIYGILADAMNIDAVKKVFEAKNRDYNKPLILLMSSLDMVLKYTNNVSELEKELLTKYENGALTLILNKNDKIDKLVTANNETVGVRIPNNRDLLEIINNIGNPLVSTSANITNKEPITNINLLEREMLEKVSYVEDGGVINSPASTIIKVVDNKILFLREGSLTNQIKKDYQVRD